MLTLPSTTADPTASAAIQIWYDGKPVTFFSVKVMVLIAPLGSNQALAPLVSFPEPLSVCVAASQVG